MKTRRTLKRSPYDTVVWDATFGQVLGVLRASVVQDPEAYTQFGGPLPTDAELMQQAHEMTSTYEVRIMHTPGFPAESQWLMLFDR